MFTNPIQTQTQAGASAPAPVQNNSVQTAISGLADIFSALSSRKTANGPDAYQVKEDWETMGTQQAAEDIKQYQLIRDTKGASAAEAWRTKVGYERVSTMGSTTSDAYNKVWQEHVGKTQLKADREAEESIQKTQTEALFRLAETGRNLVASNAVPGYNIDTLSDEDAIAIARKWEGAKAKTQMQVDKLAYESSVAGANADKKTLVSKASAVAYVNQFTADLEVKLKSFSAVKDEKLANAARDDILAFLSLKEASMTRDFSQFVAGNGGDFNQVPNQYLSGIKDQIAVVRDLVNGKYQVQSLQTTLDRLALSGTLDVLPSLDTGLKKQLYVSKVLGFDSRLSSQVLEKSGTPLNTPDYREAINNIFMGVTTATENTGVAPKDLVDPLVKSASNPDSEIQKEAADAVVASLLETTQGSRTVRTKASSQQGLPTLMAGLARMTKPGETFTAAVNAAAAREGVTPAELWTRSFEGMFRETVAPSLQFQDPNVMNNIKLDYKNGKFTVSLDEEGYRAQSGLQTNISNLSGRDMSKDKINSINSNLIKLQGVLNDGIKGYERVMNESPDDVAAVMKARLDIVLGVNRINTK